MSQLNPTEVEQEDKLKTLIRNESVTMQNLYLKVFKLSNGVNRMKPKSKS